MNKIKIDGIEYKIEDHFHHVSETPIKSNIDFLSEKIAKEHHERIDNILISELEHAISQLILSGDFMAYFAPDNKIGFSYIPNLENNRLKEEIRVLKEENKQLKERLSV